MLGGAGGAGLGGGAVLERVRLRDVDAAFFRGFAVRVAVLELGGS